MKIISLRHNPKKIEHFIEYFVRHWHADKIYRNCMTALLDSDSVLPQWYLLIDDDKIIGGVGLITNDFISRMDLWPWLCALFIEESCRGKNLGKLLIEHAKKESYRLGFENLYLCTDHTGYYEKFNFEYIGDGFHPWNESSRIYKCST
ncbi:MAG: GNAT family N-acetyltransferase [Lentisphaerae bacterium]|nr:GNAT family N-acetyltransferase [Lentisphaerota bacterium]MCP4103112.1 GNAT family N-acetyltransferase [Lentisphaerota bacterium]